MGQTMHNLNPLKWLALLTLLLGSPLLIADEEFLKPEQAFPARAEVIGEDRIRISWQVADGYYLYRDKIRVRSASEGIEAEVIDPRTLHPLDEELILESVRKTNRLVIAHEACTRFGFGAEVSALVTEKAFDWLDAPIQRVGAPFLPMPYADELERQVIPTQQQIAAAVRNCVQ